MSFVEEWSRIDRRGSDQELAVSERTSAASANEAQSAPRVIHEADSHGTIQSMPSHGGGRYVYEPPEKLDGSARAASSYESSRGKRAHLSRTLTWYSLTSMGIGATIGAGIFVRMRACVAAGRSVLVRVTPVMTGIVAHSMTGPALSLSFIVAAVVCVFCGLCYAEFASIAPSAGSAYAYTRASMGQFLAWMIGWDLILEYTVAAGAVAQSWSQYLNEFLDLFSARLPHVISAPPFKFDPKSGSMTSSGAVLDLPAFLVSLAVMTLLVLGVRDSARFNNVMVGIKVGVVLFVIGLGAALVDTANWTPFAPFGYLGLSFFGHKVGAGKTPTGTDATAAASSSDQSAGVLAGAAIVFFSYVGFDAVSCHAEEAKKPERDVPVAILLSLTISTMLYVGVSVVLTGMVPYSAIDVRAPLSTAFTQRGFHWAGYLVAIGAVVGITSVLLVTMLSQPRIFMAMARDGLMPPFFAEVHPRFQTPWKATILTGVCVSLISSLIPLTILVEFVSIGTLMAFTFVCVAVIILRRTSPDVHRPFRCPWVPVIPVLGILACLTLMFSLPATNWYRLLAWFGLGLIIYWLYGRKYGIGDKHKLMTRSHLDELDGVGVQPSVSCDSAPSTLADVVRAEQSRSAWIEGQQKMEPVKVWTTATTLNSTEADNNPPSERTHQTETTPPPPPPPAHATIYHYDSHSAVDEGGDDLKQGHDVDGKHEAV